MRTFINLQMFHDKRTQWTFAEKQLALTLYYKSPGMYKFMREKLQFCLPSHRTIQKWLKVANLRTGTNTSLIKKLELKASIMTESEKMCVVLFDEIILKKQLEYNQGQDMIEGYEDLANLGRREVAANTALVFYLRGLLFNWKIPLCYFLSKGPVKGYNLEKLILHVLRKLKKIGLHPRAITCDRGSNNRNAILRLGATEELPYFTVDNSRIYTIFDVPHLLKSLRNNFSNLKLNFSVEGNPVSWKDVIDTYKIDQKSSTTKAMVKITNTHMNPNNFQRMRVKYAAQIFSHTVSSAIKTAHATSEVRNVTTPHTAKFIEDINKIFDTQ